MATFRLFKETALPGTLVANGIYLITGTNPNYVEMYVADSTGASARRIPTESDINTLIASQIASLNSELYVVADIAARDALFGGTPTEVIQALVIDASADATVTSGAATYVYDLANTTWVKISEAESIDAVVNWSDIVGGPTSSPAAIDQAVADSHTHANKAQLDKIDEDGDGDPTYDGQNFVLKGGPVGW